MQSGKRIEYLDGLRAAAAMYVMAHHAWMIAYPGPPATAGERLLRLALGWGHAAVDVFIVLSGFCLMLPVANGGSVSAGAFYRRRARRILPTYFFALGLSGLLIVGLLHTPTGTLWDGCLAVTPAGVVTHLLLVHEWFTATKIQINAVLWSVSVEWKIYFAFPLLVGLFRRFGAGVTSIGSVVASYAALAVLRLTPIDTHTAGASVHYVGLFTLGMFAAHAAFSERFAGYRSTLPWRAILAGATLAALAATQAPLPHDDVAAFVDLFVGVWAAVLLIVLATRPAGAIASAASWRPLVVVGTFSYSLYLLHLPLLQLVWQYLVRPAELRGPANLLLVLGAGVPFALAGSYLFFLACEMPFMSRRVPRRSPGGGGEAAPMPIAATASMHGN